MRSASGAGVPLTVHLVASVLLSLKLSTRVCAFAIVKLLPGFPPAPPPMRGGAAGRSAGGGLAGHLSHRLLSHEHKGPRPAVVPAGASGSRITRVSSLPAVRRSRRRARPRVRP